MKMLYVASNPDGSENLSLDREITELQRKLVNDLGPNLSVSFFPKLEVEEFYFELANTQPDIVHIAAHGEKEDIRFANRSGSEVTITAENLLHMLDLEKIPKLVYVNACDSNKIAKVLSSKVEVAIGTTGPVSNRASRTGTLVFYKQLMYGRSLAKAFQGANALVKTMEKERGTSLSLHTRADVRADEYTMFYMPKIVAHFDNLDRQKNISCIRARIGLFDCPPDTIQVVIFTDEDEFACSECLEENLCSVIRARPKNGELWPAIHRSQLWPNIKGDFRIYACGITASQSPFVTSSTFSEAIDQFYMRVRGEYFQKTLGANEKLARDLIRNNFNGRLIRESKSVIPDGISNVLPAPERDSI